jgi:long-subunit fatty acid transport protein
MHRIAATSAALLATTAITQAGGIERNAQSPSVLFEEGTYVELSYSWVNPDVSGVQVISAVGAESGDVAPSYGFASLAYRQDINENVSFALILDEPVGADVDYSGIGSSPGYLYRSGTGSQAEINSQQLTAALRYEMEGGFSVYGGLRAISADGKVSLFTGYTMDAEGSTELGYMLGASYERPEIALRIGLTYYSETTHTFDAAESLGGPTNDTRFETTIPQQVLLEAQTGVAEGTLVFGSVRWTEWTEFDITPLDYTTTFGGSLVDYDNNVWTYTIGGARVLNENWAVLGSLAYEAEQDGFSGNLGPTDGRTSINIGARYTQGPFRITAGINYSWIGDAETEAPSLPGVPAGTQFATFEDNDSIGFGLRVGYSF